MLGYDDAIGWLRIEDVISDGAARAIVDSCETLLESIASGRSTDLRVGDKPNAGTRRLVDVVDRVVETVEIVAALQPVIGEILATDSPATDYSLVEGTYRCPQPGFGSQRLHADEVPRMDPDHRNLCATAIVPLVDFTAENGATRAVPGSHLRPDLQRLAAKLENHPDEIRLTGPVGGAFVFSGHLLHAGAKNESAAPRPALQFNFSHRGEAGHS